MNSKRSRDLGSGVRLATLADGNLLVRSEWLRLPWSVRAGNVTGTAVLVGDEALEVVACQRSGGTESWTLEPWPHDQVMRGVVTLDEAWVSHHAHEVATERRSGRLRRWSLPVAPLLGSAPAGLQSAWATRWGFPATVATTMSALGELTVAAVGIIHVMSSAFGGPGVLPPWLAWLGLLAPALAIEAVVRLKHVMAVREPIGTALLLPLSVLQPGKIVSETSTTPAVRALDLDHGALQVWSPIYRADWEPGGLLSYREALYSLSSIEREGRDWIYNFAQPDDGVVGPALRLRPPSSRSSLPMRERPPAVLRTALVTAIACLAPCDLQQEWAARIAAPAVLLTVLGAGAECCGALVNLAAADSAEATALLVVNLFFLVEGTVRFVLLAATSRPVGSLVGLAFRPFLERLMAG